MALNISLLGQLITFALFVWFTMRFVWPPLQQAMHERQKKIAEGLAAAERAREDSARAREETQNLLREAQAEARAMVQRAEARAKEMQAQAKAEAQNESERFLAQAKEEIEKDVMLAKSRLRLEAANLAVGLAEEILKKEIDRKAHETLIEQYLKKAS